MSQWQITLSPQTHTRLDHELLRKVREKHPAISRAAIKTWFQNGFVLLHGRTAKPSYLIEPGHPYEITILNFDSSSVTSVRAVASERGAFLPVIFENDEILVLNKSSGVPSLPHSSEDHDTAVSAALAQCPELAGIGNGGLEPGLLHRLDTGTSGVLLFAKTDTEFERLRELWRLRRVRKIYRAIVSLDRPLPERFPFSISLPIAHDAKSDRRMQVIHPDAKRKYRGKPLPAVTHILGAHARSAQQADIEIELETGVMHQIRAHCADAGWPLVGDPIYGTSADIPATRLMLHAWKLGIPLKNGEMKFFEAALPENWKI